MSLDLERYRHPALRQLAEQQVRYAPVTVRLTQLERVELFLLGIRSDSVITYPDLFREITGRRTEIYPSLELAGDVLLHDLRCFVEDLSDSMSLDAANFAEPVLTQEEIAKQFNVSISTVERWRERGLAGRRVRCGNRKRICFLKSHIERFVELHRDEIHRSALFSHVAGSEKEWMIRRARRLARYGASQIEVTKRLAKRLGRAVETIRAMLKKHDAEYPHAAVFPDATAPLSDEARREIFLSLKRGASATKLAKQYARTRSSVYRVAKEYRAEMLMKQPIDYVHSTEFDEEDADAIMLQPNEGLDVPVPTHEVAPSEIPAYLSDLYEFPVLTREQEHFLFRKMNYLKHKAVLLQKRLPSSKQIVVEMDLLESLLEQSLSVKNVIVRCNLRLVVSVARKHKQHGENFFEMVSDGNLTLLRAIETFDFCRGTKFSSYATWALMKSYARTVPGEGQQLNRFQTGSDELISVSQDQRGASADVEEQLLQQGSILESIIDRLNEREQEAISMRFALRGNSKTHTLEEISARLGLSKERARQIIASGLEKLREIIQREELFDEDEFKSP